MIINNDVLLLSATNEETPYKHLLHYPKRSGTCIIGHFEVERETGTEFCRIALWYCFRMRSPFLIGYYKVAQGAGSKFAPQIASNGKLQLSRGNREVNGNCNLWHAWFDCCCIAKSNTGTVYAPKNIPNRNQPPPPPSPKKCKKCIINDVFTN